MVKTRMAIGVSIPTVSVQGIANNVAGLGSYITSFFGSTAVSPEHTSNKVWNEPINGDAKGMFQVYYQNVHGIPRDDTTLAQDIYKHWQSSMSAVSVYQKQILTGTEPMCEQTFLQGNKRHGNMQQHHSH